MDPLSITVAATSLAYAVQSASDFIHAFIDGTKNVDTRVKQMSADIDALLTILHAMKNIFDTPGTQTVLKSAKDVGTLLGAVKTSIDDCLTTAKEIEAVFEMVSKEKGDSKTVLARAFRHLKLSSKQDDLEKYNARIHQHKTNMQLSLQTVNVWVTAKSWQAQMDELRGLIKEMRIEQFDKDNVIDISIVQHSQALQSTAHFFVSRQATLVAHDDDDWTRIGRQSTDFTKSPVKSEGPQDWEEILDTDEEMEADLSSELLDSGIKLCNHGKYAEAESTLKNSIQDAMRKKLLYHHRRKIKEAQLKLGVAYLWQGKFEAADPVLRGVAALPTNIKGMSENLPLTLDAYYYLAQISLAYHDYTAALRDCQKCVKGRKKELGESHPTYLEALVLLVLIQRTSGDEISANTYQKQIPEEMRQDRRGISVFKYSIDGHWLSVQEEKRAIRTLEEESPGLDDHTNGQNLRWAALEGHLDIVRLMLYRGAPIASTTYDGSAAVHCAARTGHANVVKLLIQKGADVNQGFPAKSPLHDTVMKNAVRSAQYLLEAGAKIDGSEGEVDYDFSIVMGAAVHGSNGVLELLLEHNGRADVWNKSHKRSALMYAIREGNSETMKLLLKAGANVNGISLEGQTPLTFAAENRKVENIRVLLDHGAKPDPPAGAPEHSPTALTAASRMDQIEIAKLLLAKGADPNHRGPDGLGPLALAANNRNGTAMIKLLLDHGADPNAQVASHKHSATPLYNAINQENEEVVLLLLNAGANVNQVSYGSSTPLDAAQRSNLESIAEALFERGATLEGNVDEYEKKDAASLLYIVVRLTLLTYPRASSDFRQCG